MFEIKVGDVWNVPPGYRGEHPLGGYGNSGNFYKAYSDKWHYDFKSKTLYDGTLALAVDIGLRNKTTVSQGNYTDKELFKIWLEAKRRGLIPKDAAIPARGLNYYAVSRGLCDRDELVAVDQADGSEDEDSTFAGLPAGVYNDAVDKLYREFDVNPGLGQKETDADDDEPTDDPDTSDSDTDVTESDDPLDEFVVPEVKEMSEHEEAMEVFVDKFIEQHPDPSDCDDPHPEWTIMKKLLYSMYREWSNHHGWDKILQSVFMHPSKMRSALDVELDSGQHRTETGERKRYYRYISTTKKGEELASTPEVQARLRKL